MDFSAVADNWTLILAIILVVPLIWVSWFNRPIMTLAVYASIFIDMWSGGMTVIGTLVVLLSLPLIASSWLHKIVLTPALASMIILLMVIQ